MPQYNFREKVGKVEGNMVAATEGPDGPSSDSQSIFFKNKKEEV